ncbi:MAG: DAK2 domain-containing protein [Dehalococcoidia bacterium]
MTTPPGISALNGKQLRDAFAAAARHLADSATAVDAINVYPVPDGDTGSNMAATLREAVDGTAGLPEPVTVAAVLGALARGALYGARGNSGVILSQALRGFAQGVGDVGQFDAAALARGLESAAAAAYGAVGKPVEGTMLTVLRRAAEEAVGRTRTMPDRGGGAPCLPVLLEAIGAAEVAEAQTPELLPELAEAGVPDAGGEGVCVILRGLAGYLTGHAPPAPAMPDRPIATLAGHAPDGFGFCTEFVLEPAAGPVDLESVRGFAMASGQSVVVVGDAAAVRVHLHSRDPERVLAEAARFGSVKRAKVDDMTAQNIRFEASGSGATAKLGLLAMSRGAGLDQVFRGLGATVADLGEVVKPPAGEIAAAAEALGKADVIVLPNHKNVVPAARQAASLARCTLHVVETANLVQGIAAAVAFDPQGDAAENVREMTEAAGAVRSVEVTIAAADRRADGVQARKGEAIAMVDGRLVSSLPSLAEALVAGLHAAGAADASLLTIYAGATANADQEQAARAAIAAAFPAAESEFVPGGQPLYPFIASVER